MELDIDVVKIGKRGVFVIPADLRQQYGLDDGAFVIPEATEDGILLKPATVMPMEVYTPARRAEFMLSNASDAKEYQVAVTAVLAMGLNPEEIPHYQPGTPDAPAVS